VDSRKALEEQHAAHLAERAAAQARREVADRDVKAKEAERVAL
jgi:hypothetical protein